VPLTGARYAVPVHWKTLHVPAGEMIPRGWMDIAGPRFVDALAREAPDCRAVELEPVAPSPSRADSTTDRVRRVVSHGTGDT
jgi:hypothetical protein